MCRLANRRRWVACILREFGGLPEAIATYERALAVGEAAHEPDQRESCLSRAQPREAQRVGDHPGLASDLNGLGIALHLHGDIPAARAAFERALGALENAPEPDPSFIASIYANLAAGLRRNRVADPACPRF